MNYRNLGSTDIAISELAMGCMSLSDDQEMNDLIIQRAIDGGINLFDTADLYDFGGNEESVGKSLKGFRDRVVIATKVGNEWNNDRTSWRWNPTKKYIVSAIDMSLKRLQTDYIDIYQLHGGTIEDPIDETIEAFELLKKQGKIRAYGISSIRPNVIREYVKRSNIDSVMMQYSLLDRRPEEEVLGLLEDSNISVLCRGVLAKGILVDKPASEYLGYSTKEVQSLKERLAEYENPIGEALGYTLSSKAVGSNIVGVRSVEQLEGVLEAYLSGAVGSVELRKVLEPNVYESHR